METELCRWCWLRNAPAGLLPRCEVCTYRYTKPLEDWSSAYDADAAARLDRAAGFSPAADHRTLMVWSFDDAPIEYKCLSTHGGDEDWLMYVPPGYEHMTYWAEPGTAFGCCDVSEHKLSSGAVILIGAHA